MLLPPTLAWLVDAAADCASPDRLLAELGPRLAADGRPIAGGALSVSVAHPLIARRAWMWRADTGEVFEALGFGGAAAAPNETERRWLADLASGPLLETRLGGAEGPWLAWAGRRAFTPAEIEALDAVARFSAAPLAALSARATLQATLEAYLGRRSAAQALAAPLRRVVGETIAAALLFADLRGFTEMSEREPPEKVIGALDAWFDRIAGAIHAFGGEVLKFIGDGVLAIFPVADGAPRPACEAALNAVVAARAGMARLNERRGEQGEAPLAFGAALHLGEILWGNIGAANRLDFTAIGPSVNLVSRLEGLCKPLGESALVSGALAAQIETQLKPLGAHPLRGVATPCPVFALPEDLDAPADERAVLHDDRFAAILVDAPRAHEHEAPLRSLGLAFADDDVEKGDDVAGSRRIRPAHVFDAGRDAERRQRIAGGGAFGEAAAARIDNRAHGRGGDVPARGAEAAEDRSPSPPPCRRESVAGRSAARTR